MTATLTVSLPSFGTAPGGDWRGLLVLARAAEDAGVDRLVVSDHVVLGPNVDQYPWGRFPTASDGEWLDPLSVLSAVAAVTTRVRLGTSVLIAPLRPAAVLAKTVATLDQLSGGRVDLGVGTGWQREEYEAVGADFDRRGELLTSTIAECRALWEGRVPDVWCEPRPVQARVPVWFSGTLHARNVRRVVELGDGWIPVGGPTADDIGRDVGVLRDAFIAAGRDPSELRLQASTRHLDAIPALVAAGATTINVFLRQFYDNDPGTARAALDTVVAAFRSLAD